MKWALLLLMGLFAGFTCEAQQLNQKKSVDSTLYLSVTEDQPKFPGGDTEFKKFISKNLRWPAGDIDAEGSVIISFIVQRDGRLTDFKILRSLHPAFDKEALLLLKKSPKWIPAKQNGKIVKSRYTVPIRFSVED